MAQRTEKEETKFKVAETLTLCINNCGLIGNPATNNMCQKCFNATATTTAAAATSASNNTPGATTSVSSGAGTVSTSPRSSTCCVIALDLQSPADQKAETSSDRKKEGGDVSVVKREVNRCWGCRRKVGLTGFRCRCGELFCSEHRYSDRHDCTYDYKTAGREAIARENPVVKAAKIVRV